MAKLAFIGLGVMGFPMAGHLVTSGGHDVTVFNRTREKAYSWAARFGGKAASSPAEAVKQCDVAFSCVGNDDDLREITIGPNGAFRHMKSGAVFVDHTTASASVAREFDFGFAVDWMRKDLGICLDQARTSHVSLPVTALIDQFYADIQRKGGGRLDCSALISRFPRRPKH